MRGILHRDASGKEFFMKAHRFYKNGKEALGRSKIEYGRYLDEKSVKEGCGICYLGVLSALDGYLLSRGVSVDKLSSSIQGYWAMLKRFFAKNGRLVSAFSTIYENLHIFGYYRGGLMLI
jgi:hypothetical protein